MLVGEHLKPPEFSVWKCGSHFAGGIARGNNAHQRGSGMQHRLIARYATRS